MDARALSVLSSASDSAQPPSAARWHLTGSGGISCATLGLMFINESRLTFEENPSKFWTETLSFHI